MQKRKQYFPPHQGGGVFSPLRAGEDTAMKMAGSLHPPFSLFLARRKRENGPCTVQKRKRSTGRTRGRAWMTGGRQEGLPRGAVKRELVLVDLAYFSFRCRWPGRRIGLDSFLLIASSIDRTPVGAAALRPPLAALPLTAAAYPLRVLGSPSPATAMLHRLFYR